MKNLFIVVGWYLENSEFYKSLFRLKSQFPNLDILIASHKSKETLSAEFIRDLELNNINIQFFRNEGFDWGAYSQSITFLGDKIREYKYIFFMHDDIVIKDFGFVDKFIKVMQERDLVILGNSINISKAPFKRTHPYIIEWARLSDWKIAIKSDKWSTARGSFFVAKEDVFEKVKTIPYRVGHAVGFGNWSLRIFFGLVTDQFGINSIGVYSDKYLSSEYIDEYERGIASIKDEQEIKKSYEMEINTVRDLKLNLFCGTNYLVGYLNIDKDQNPLADLLMNFNKLEFRSRSVNEIIISNFEKINYQEIDYVCEKIVEWIQPGRSVLLYTKKRNSLEKLHNRIVNKTNIFEALESKLKMSSVKVEVLNKPF